MAMVSLTPIKCSGFNSFVESTTTLFTAVDGTLGASFVMDEQDSKYGVLVYNGNATTAKSVTIKKGNGLQGVSDISYSLPSGAYTLVTLESGAFKNVSGENKDKVIIVGESADIEVCVIKLA